MKKESPKIVVIEGVWAVGKSTIISNIRSLFPVLFIPEPNHIESGIKSNITEWYKKQHVKRMELAKKYCSYGENTIMERSIISSAAFYYAQNRSVPKWFNEHAKNISVLSNLHIIFLYNNKRTFIDKISEIENKKVVAIALGNKFFYDNYVYFYTDILPKLIRNKVVCMKVSKNRNLTSKDKKYFKKLLDSSYLNAEKK